jgi:hypothetical protein
MLRSLKAGIESNVADRSTLQSAQKFRERGRQQPLDFTKIFLKYTG